MLLLLCFSRMLCHERGKIMQNSTFYYQLLAAAV